MALETFDVHGLTVKLHTDFDCASPRDNDNLGLMVCWNRRYTLGDVQPTETREEWLRLFKHEHPDWRSAVILAVHMVEHSGVALSTRPFRDPCDSGQVGWIYALPATIRKEHGTPRITKEVRAHVATVLQSEVEEYGRWLDGDCYGYTVEDANGEELDSCWGFIGYAYAEQAAKEAAIHYTLVEQP